MARLTDAASGKRLLWLDHTAYSARLPLCVQPAMPTAQAMLQLAPALLAQNAACDPALALPRYVRDKVAQTTAERAALQQATQHAQAATSTTPSA